MKMYFLKTSMCFSLPSAQVCTLPDALTDGREAIDCIDNSPIGASQDPVIGHTMSCTAFNRFVILLVSASL